MTPKEACIEALKRVARNFNSDMSKLAQFDLNFYALRKDGAYAGAALWSGRIRNGKLQPSMFAVNDGGASRHERRVVSKYSLATSSTVACSAWDRMCS